LAPRSEPRASQLARKTKYPTVMPIHATMMAERERGDAEIIPGSDEADSEGDSRIGEVSIQRW
jgi:hypothetical protein